MNTFVFLSNSPEETLNFAAEFVGRLTPPRTIALYGEIGAGKTCFVQGLAKGLNIQGPVSSPTFVIINEYEGKIPLYHMDLYRLLTAEDALMIGIEEYFERPGITVIEWAERAEEILPSAAIRIHLEFAGEMHRRITINPAVT